MKTWCGTICMLLGCSLSLGNDAPLQLARHLPDSPALVVVVCGPDKEDVAAVADLVEQTEWTVCCQGTGNTKLEALREWARSRSLLGRRISIIDRAGDRLWLASNMADAAWVSPRVTNVPSQEEVMRVLRPGGVYLAAGQATIKPLPKNVDQWRHPYHSPNNNVVSEDSVARLPGELRFQTYPVFAAMPNQTLMAGGRIFFFSGHIAFHQREEASLNRLTCMNAYNGLTLWTRALDSRYVVHNVAKVATDQQVVFAEGNILRILDAATGQQQGAFAAPEQVAAGGDTDWKWIAQQDHMLWAAFGPPDAQVTPHRQRSQMGHWPWNVANDRYQGVIDNFGNARTLVAFRFPDMKVIWSVTESDRFDARTLCMDDGRIFQLSPTKYAVARDADSGEEIWRQVAEKSSDLFEAIGSAVKRQGWGIGWATYCCARASDDVVCIAGPPFRKTIGIDFSTGQLLWSIDVESPHPFFFRDTLFLVPRVGGPTVGCQQLAPKSGDVLNHFSLGVIGSCSRLTVTPTQFFYRPGGGEGRTVFVDLETRKLADYEGIVRPGCFDGVIPANGRLYWMPLACDCWQVHGTFSMAPRSPVANINRSANVNRWNQPVSTTPAEADDWPMFRATSAGTATVSTPVGNQARQAWRQQMPGTGLTAPIQVGDRIFVGDQDGTVSALDAATGQVIWQRFCRAGLTYPPAYWNGRVIFGACDGFLYAADAVDGRLLGSVELAPERRLVNIMGQLMSTWPLGGGVLVDPQGIAYTAAGSTAADGAIVAAINVATGDTVWKQAYTLDRNPQALSFGVQSNLLLDDKQLVINGGAPIGVVCVDAGSGENPRVVAKLEAGSEMFLEPDGKPSCGGPELYSDKWTRTTIFKRHQGRVFFSAGDRKIALIGGRLFCARDTTALDGVVDLMNKDPRTGGRFGGDTVPRKAMQISLDDRILWAGDTADVRGVAIGTDGVIALCQDRVAAMSLDGESRWDVALPAAPVRWGLAMSRRRCVITLEDGSIVCMNIK